jgi:hypothetical protein
MMRSRFGKWLVGIGIATALSGSHQAARAVDDNERAGARAAATEGLKAFDAKRYADAADLFSRAESVIHSPVHVLYIARSQVALGTLVKAQETYRKLAREELAANAPPPFRKAVEDANRELKELEPRLPYVTVTVPGRGDAAVEMDGKRVPPGLVGVPLPVDPGAHKFKTTAEGLSKELSVTLKEGERQNVALTLEPAQSPAGAQPGAPAAAAPSPAPSAATPAAAAPAAAPMATPPVPTEEGKSGSWMRIAGFAGIGVGVVGVAVGTIFLAQSGSKSSEGNKIFDRCDPTPAGCSAAERAQIDKLDEDAKSSKITMSVVGYAVGGVGLAAGITLLVLAPKSQSTTARRVTPWVGYNSVGVQGSF